MTTYTNPFTGQTIYPSTVSYESITLSANLILQWPINGNTNTPVSSIIDVTATSTGYYLILPPAPQVSTGQSILIRNTGSNPFTVAANSGTTAPGTTIVSIASGVAEYIWLTDNTTNAGTWTQVQFGAGTSSANAAQLAGYGLAANGVTLNENNPVTFINSSTTLSSTSQAQLLVWNTGAGSLTLPSAATVGNGWYTIVSNGGTGILTLTPAGTDTINGNANQQLQLTESLVIVSNGSTGWNTYGYGRSNSFPYTQLALTVTGGTLTLSSTQASNTIQEYSGTLTSNQIIVLPPTVQLYSITNTTTGSYTLTFKTSVSGGATLTIAQNQSVIAVCDGTNVYNANSGAVGTLTSITLASGTVSTPTLNYTGDTTTGLYHPASGQLAVTTGGTQAALFTGTNVAFPVGLSGGTF
jgi:hypothetical protein